MGPATLTTVDRLKLANQYKILEKLDPENAEAYAELRRILEEGISIFYENVFEYISPEIGLQTCNFVKDVVEMFLDLQRSFKKLHDRSGLDDRDILFYGFYIVEEERRFFDFLKMKGGEPEQIWEAGLKILRVAPGSDLGIHRTHYEEMLNRWNEIKAKYAVKEKWNFTNDEIKAIIADDNISE